jgi:chromate transporter
MVTSAVPGRRVKPSYAALARVSALLGVVGFGGGISVLGQMRDALVVRRRWLTEREFDVTATVSQMLPGGAAANALAYTGLRFHGALGAVVAYTAFIAPGAIVVTVLAALYVNLGVAPRLEPLLAGLNAAVVGVVASITLQMVRTAVARPWQMGVAAAALLFASGGAASAGEVAAFGIGAGLVLDLVMKRFRLARIRRAGRRPSPPVALPDEGTPFLPPAEHLHPSEEMAAEQSPTRTPLPAAWLFGPASAGALATMAILLVRAGLGAYGGGFAIIPNLKATALAAHWLTERQFADAVSIGKLTPGPVLLMATFIGYLVHGAIGAFVATIAVFAGPLVLVVAVGAWLARVRSRRSVRAALRGLTPAVVGLMAAATLTLGGSLAGPPDLAIAGAALLTLTRFRVNPVLVMALGGVARLGLRAAGI